MHLELPGKEYEIEIVCGSKFFHFPHKNFTKSTYLVEGNTLYTAVYSPYFNNNKKPLPIDT